MQKKHYMSAGSWHKVECKFFQISIEYLGIDANGLLHPTTEKANTVVKLSSQKHDGAEVLVQPGSVELL